MKRQIFVNLLIFFLFAGGVYFTIKPLIAELHFDSAQKLKAQYRWNKAAEEYKRAVAFDPSNAKYHGELGYLYMTIGRFGQDKTGWCLKAEEEYKKAIKLNPMNGTYYLNLEKAQFELLSDKADISSAEIARCVGYLKHAVELEPHNYYINAAAGYYCLLLYERVKGQDEGREFVLSKLRYSLELNPSYSGYLYAALWNRLGDFKLLQKITPDNLTGQQGLLFFIQEAGLWQYRKRQADLVKTYKEKEQPQSYKQEQLIRSKEIDTLKLSFAPSDKWQGRAGGNMYWTGTINTLVNLAGGRVIISIKACGSPANGIYPYMIVELDGKEIGEAYVTGSEWKDYYFEAETNGGKKVLSVSFINDGGNIEKKEDRNLFVGDVVTKQKQEILIDK